MRKYTSAITGGTFDHFHVGHTALLDAAFALAQNVTIGITTQNLYKNKYLSFTIESFKKRKASVADYLKKNNYVTRATILSIDNIYGNSLENPSIDAIIANRDNIHNVTLINEMRLARGLKRLEVELIEDIIGNDNRKISSERIRAGEIDRAGNAYIKYFEFDLYLPKTIRTLLRTRLGKIIKTVDINNIKSVKDMTIAVGDIVSLSFLEAGYAPDLCIIDFKTRRHDISKAEYKKLEKISKIAKVCENNPGSLSSNAVATLQKDILYYMSEHQKQTLVINGEEDLMTLPAILLSPLGTLVFYGQYQKGMIRVEVTEDKKNYITMLIKQFTRQV